MSNPPPTLLTELSIAPLLGAVALLGATPGYDIASVSPAPASISSASLVPTVITQSGPTAAPDLSTWDLEGRVPSLLMRRIISPTLPDAIPAENDLAPTLVWQETCLPAQSPLGLSGLVPAVILDSGQRIYPPAGSVLISPQAPTVVPPDAQVPLREPTRAQLGMIELAPTLVTGMTLALPASVLTAQGYAPQLVGLRYGWQPLPPAAAPGWTEVPRV